MERKPSAASLCGFGRWGFVLVVAAVIAGCVGAASETTPAASAQPTTQDDGEIGFPMGKASSAITCSVQPGAYCTAGCEVDCPGKQRAICTLGTRACNAITGCSCRHEPSCRCQLL